MVLIRNRSGNLLPGNGGAIINPQKEQEGNTAPPPRKQTKPKPTPQIKKGGVRHKYLVPHTSIYINSTTTSAP